MKAILLAGGMGTRLRPLTLQVPKPVVPIFNRPFLHYQLDRLKRVPEIDEVRLSLNYRPDLIEQVFGDGSEAGIRIRYIVEPEPLGTGGAVRFAGHDLQETVVVFNGDVLTQIDLADVIRLHRARKAKATIVLSMVGKNYRLTQDMREAAALLKLPITPTFMTLRQIYADAPGQAAVVWHMGSRAREAAVEVDRLFRELLPDAVASSRAAGRRRQAVAT